MFKSSENMNEISLKRIGFLLFNTESFEGKYQKRVMFLLSMVLIPIFLAWFLVWLDFFDGFIIFMVYMMTSYTTFASLNTDKSKEINYLLLPASTKEKIIAHIIQAVSVPTVILAVTVPAIVLMQGVINLRAGGDMLSYMPVFEALTVTNFLIGLLLQAMFGFAALVFRKIAMIKGLLLVLPILCIVVSAKVLLEMGGIMNGIVLCLFNAILLFLTVSIWILNYYKLKKREI